MNTEIPTTDNDQRRLPPRGRWGWLAAVILVAVMATIGVVLTSKNGQSTEAGAPTIDNPAPTEPGTEEAPEARTPSTATEASAAAPEGEAVGVSGFPIFEGSPPPGDYEAGGEDLRLIITSDGEWRDCIRTWCDVGGGVEIQPKELLSVYGWFEPSPAPEELRSSFSGIEGLVVGPMKPFEPSHPEADWSGRRFTVDVEPDAPRHHACAADPLDPDYACVEVPFLSPFFVSNADHLADVNLYIHGPTEFMVLTTADGSDYWAAPIWFPYPPAPEGAYELINQRFVELVQTIRFFD